MAMSGAKTVRRTRRPSFTNRRSARPQQAGDPLAKIRSEGCYRMVHRLLHQDYVVMLVEAAGHTVTRGLVKGGGGR